MTTCLLIPLFKMRLFRSSCCRPVLSFSVFLTVVYSASLKDQNDEFISFLTDALNMNVPPESPAPDIFPVLYTQNSLNPPDPTAVCTTPGPVDHFTEISNVTPEPGSVEFSDTADEKSKENSNSAEHTDDSDYRNSKKRNRLPETLKQPPDNSADSNSAERPYMGVYVNMATKEQPRKTQVIKDRSSEETEAHLDFETNQERKRMMIPVKESEKHGGTENNETVTTDNDLPVQSFTEERKRKNKIEPTVDRDAKAEVKQVSDSTPLSESPGGIHQNLDCTELSSKSVGYPNRMNTRVSGLNTDPESKVGITDYESRLRKMCATRKRLRAPSIPREQLDPDSVERVNSELLDRDNSNEMIDAGMPAYTL